MFAPWKKNYDKLGQHIKKQRHYFANKCSYSHSCSFPSSHVHMWELDHKERWVLKNWYFKLWCWRRLLRVSWAVRRSNKSILKKINPEYSLKGLMLKMMLQYFGTWCEESTHWDWRHEERGTTEVSMVGWHHQLNGHEFEQTLGDGERQ